LGLEYLNAYLWNNGIESKVIDLKKELIKNPNYHIKKYNPEYVGTSMFHTDWNKCLNILKCAKTLGKKTVIGGYTPTAVSELLALQHYNIIDFIVRGEGEQTLYELVSGKELSKIDGLTYISKSIPLTNNISLKDYLIVNKDRKFMNIDEIPPPIRKQRKYRYKAGMSNPDKEKDVILFSRGCWGKCTFCCEPYMSRSNQRLRNPRKIVFEILEIIEYHNNKPLHISICDPHLPIERTKWIDEIITLLPDLNNVYFSCLARPDIIARHPDTVNKIIKKGINCFEMGIESPSNNDLYKVKKYYPNKIHKEAIKVIHDAGGQASGTLVIGLPNHTRNEILYCADYAKKIGLDSCAFGIATPFHGTEFAKKFRFPNELIDLERFNEMQDTFIKRYLKFGEVEELHTRCLVRFWLCKKIIKRNILDILRKIRFIHHSTKQVRNFRVLHHLWYAFDEYLKFLRKS